MKLLVVDDERDMLEVISDILSERGFFVKIAQSGEEGLKILSGEHFEIVITDLRMPKMDGLSFLTQVKKKNEDICVIILSAYGDIPTAVEAMRKGAFDFVTKPLNPKVLLATIGKAKEFLQLKSEKEYLRKKVSSAYEFDKIVGKSKAMKQIFDIVKQIAPTNSTVLIEGESGVGKELIANAIHHHSHRASKPMVKVNCAALPESLAESELFGHEKGAYTGATSEKQGFFEAANEGTILLDEVSELSSGMQAKLLRVIENGEFMKVGSPKPVKVDVRIITSTNQNLKERVKSGKFREDLYYRLNVISIKIPPLRERVEDVIILAKHFLKRFSEETNKNIEGFKNDALKLMKEYHWPGNVRELENAVERAVVLAKGSLIKSEDLPIVSYTDAGTLPLLEAREKEQIEQVLRETNWRMKKAASILGISRGTLYNKVSKYGIIKDKF